MEEITIIACVMRLTYSHRITREIEDSRAKLKRTPVTRIFACICMRNSFDLQTKCHRRKRNSLIDGKRTNLLHRTLCLKKYPPAKELAKNATDTPNVHGCGIVSRSHQDFRCTIILRHHFLRHVLVLIGFFHSGQTKVADLLANKIYNFVVIKSVERSIVSLIFSFIIFLRR